MADQRPSVLIVSGDEIPGVEFHFPKIIAWLRDAGRPYHEYLLAGLNPDEVLRRWLNRPTSEFALQYIRVLIVDDDIAGGYLALRGKEVARCRQEDLLDLARRRGRAAYAQIRACVRDLYPLFSPIRRNDYYLSRIGLLPHKRGQGLAHYLIQDCIERATQFNADRIRLDVSGDNQIAISLFESHQFEVDYRGHATVANLFYEGMKREL